MIAAMDQPAVEELERIAAEASLRALAEQERNLHDLRDRAGTLLAAGALTVSFLGAQALEMAGLGIAAWLAIASFVLCLLPTLYVLLPRKDLTFTLDGPIVYERLWQFNDDPTEIHYRLALDFAVPGREPASSRSPAFML
jgi:tetrahydromethanopterin S-methyltransferase subunit B